MNKENRNYNVESDQAKVLRFLVECASRVCEEHGLTFTILLDNQKADIIVGGNMDQERLLDTFKSISSDFAGHQHPDLLGEISKKTTVN